MPGYCVQGTIGAKVLAGMKNVRSPLPLISFLFNLYLFVILCYLYLFNSCIQIRVDPQTTVNVNCAIENLSFSAHVDSKGIMQLIQQIEPKNVMLVHGEKERMYAK